MTAPAILAVLFPRALAWNSPCPSVDLRSPLQFQILYINPLAVLVISYFSLLDIPVIMTILELANSKLFVGRPHDGVRINLSLAACVSA